MNSMLKYAILSLMCVVSYSADVPDFLHICKRNDPALQQCFRKSVLALKPYLSKGVPEYKIPKTEPLVLKELLVSEPTGPTQGIRISANNIKVFGCSDFDVRNVNIDFDAGIMNFDVLLKHIFIDGVYAINGRILLIPVTGSGQVVGNFTNCVGVCKMDAELVKRDGKDYINVKSMDLKIQVGKGSIHLFNLFGGEGVLGDVINNVINENFDSFSKELFPALERELSRLFLKLTNSIVSQYTYLQLFPNN